MNKLSWFYIQFSKKKEFDFTSSFTFSQKPAYLFSNIRRLLCKIRQLFIKIRRLFSAYLIHCKSKSIKTTFEVY
mgnify:CR=1 FL=1